MYPHNSDGFAHYPVDLLAICYFSATVWYVSVHLTFYVFTTSGRLSMFKDFPFASTYDAQLWPAAHQLVEDVAKDPRNSVGFAHYPVDLLAI